MLLICIVCRDTVEEDGIPTDLVEKNPSLGLNFMSDRENGSVVEAHVLGFRLSHLQSKILSRVGW